MSFFTAPPQFLADNPDWRARYKAEADALTDAEARAAVAGEAVRKARQAAIDARADRLAGRKADSEETHQERIAAAEARAGLAAKSLDAAAEGYYKAWMSDSATLAEFSRAELAKSVE
ncbi:hypothetical protein [Micromonospora sp. NPDC005806]|uniref:hypothetical protein n=1 Tax=Micromonospora sp. NPDC005806 TaxID=3364234 RepID=UPI0036A83831